MINKIKNHKEKEEKNKIKTLIKIHQSEEFLTERRNIIMTEDIESYDISEIMDIPQDYYRISVPKLKITEQIKEGLINKHLSIRKLSENIGLKHPQIIRVTSAKNYNIDTLLKILDGLDLEIEIKQKR